jgi:integral membrane sensor domain MASE1
MEFYSDTIKLYSLELKRLASSVTGRLISSVLDGVIGSVILILFCSLVVAEHNLLRFVPLILAFNTATSGYSFVKKCKKRQSRTMIYAVCAGLLVVVSVCLFFNFFFWHTGTITVYRGAVFMVIGFIASGCGGWLAIKYHGSETISETRTRRD